MTLLFLGMLVYKHAFLKSIPTSAKTKLHFSLQERKECFTTSVRFSHLLAQLETASWICFKKWVLGWINYHEMMHNCNCRSLSVWNIQSNSTSCNIMPFLCFLEALHNITSATLYRPHGIIQGLWYCTKQDEKYAWELQASTFLLWCTIYETKYSHKD